MLLFWESLNNSYLCEAGMLCCCFGNLLTIAICVRLACCAVVLGIS